MQLLYNSDSFSVLLFDVETSADAGPGDHAPAGGPGPRPGDARLRHGGYEIVDKFARKEIFLQGTMAQSFRDGVDALIESQPSEEEIDDYIERFASLMHQPVVLH